VTARTIRLAVIGGDGIGPEVVAEAIKVLRAATVGVSIQPTSYDLGSQRWHRTGEILPDSVLTEIAGHDAILLGAVGDPSVPSGLLERGLLLRLRFELDQYVNVRPVRLYPGVASPLSGLRAEALDILVIREGTEGPYVEAGGVIRKGTVHEIATQESLNTAFGVSRVARYALARAAQRPRKKLTLVHKTNVLVYAGDLWRRTVQEQAAAFGGVTADYCHMDAASMYLVTAPERALILSTPRRACSSRCTAARLTSPASRRRIPRPPSCRPRCCASTSAWRGRQRGSSRQWPRTWSSARVPGPRDPRRRSVTTSPSAWQASC